MPSPHPIVVFAVVLNTTLADVDIHSPELIKVAFSDCAT